VGQKKNPRNTQKKNETEDKNCRGGVFKKRKTGISNARISTSLLGVKQKECFHRRRHDPGTIGVTCALTHVKRRHGKKKKSTSAHPAGGWEGRKKKSFGGWNKGFSKGGLGTPKKGSDNHEAKNTHDK